MTYYRTLGAIDPRVGEGGSGASSGSGGAVVVVPSRGFKPQPRRVTVAAPITASRGRDLASPVVRPAGFEGRPVPSAAVIAAAAAASAQRPPGFEPRPAPGPTALQTALQARPSSATYSAGKEGFELELEEAPAAAAPKSRLPLYLLIGVGAVVGFRYLRRRK